MRRTAETGLWLVLMLLAAPAPAAVTDIDTEILRCAAVADADQRLQCYDAVGRRMGATSASAADPRTEPVPAGPPDSSGTPTAAPAVTAAPDVAALPAAAAVTDAAAVPDGAAVPGPVKETARQESTAATGAAAPASLPEDLGGGDFAEQPEPEPQGALGHVTSCKKGPDAKYYFFFEGGQVWKQVNLERPRLRLDGCDFDAVITQDLFGYKMKIEGREDVIRVSRKQ